MIGEQGPEKGKRRSRGDCASGKAVIILGTAGLSLLARRGKPAAPLGECAAGNGEDLGKIGD